jgi:tetraacyldisaccharide 4'-kinase
MGPEAAGDEPFMMAATLNNIPVVVGKRRFEAGMLAIKEFNPDIVVLDDAFQHIKLWRDLNLVLLDHTRPFGNSYLLPRGTLREPIGALKRGDVFILTRSDYTPDKITAESIDVLTRLAQAKPVFRSFHRPRLCKVIKVKSDSSFQDGSSPRAQDFSFLRGCRVFAFSGLAHNMDFQRTIKDFKVEIVGFLEFADHHRYSAEDLAEITRLAREANAEYLLTTEKDYARIFHVTSWPIDLVVIGVRISLGEDEPAFHAYIKNRLRNLIKNKPLPKT